MDFIHDGVPFRVSGQRALRTQKAFSWSSGPRRLNRVNDNLDFFSVRKSEVT
jgi:hypothetical protein